MAESQIIVITGGARAGKSQYAAALAEEALGPLLYIGTAEANGDPDLAERISRLRASRSKRFATMEAPVEITSALASLRGVSTAVLDCASTWIYNMVWRGFSHGEIVGRSEAFLEVVGARENRTIIVTSEIGAGPEPEDPKLREWRNLQGALNQRLVQAANGVIMMVSGLPLKIKTRQGTRLFAG